MKTPVEIYDKLTTRWEEKKAEINRFPRSRVIDLTLMVVPWSALFAWATAQHQWSVAGFALLMHMGCHAQLLKSWRLEEQIERLERAKQSESARGHSNERMIVTVRQEDARASHHSPSALFRRYRPGTHVRAMRNL